MTKARTKSRRTREGDQNGLPDLDGLLDTLRSIWASTERDDAAVRDHLRRKIVDDLERLKKQINGKARLAEILRQPAATRKAHPSLFADESPQDEQQDNGARASADAPGETGAVPRFGEPQLRVCSNDLGEHAMRFIPKAADFSDIESYREYLLGKLPFNSVATRQRYAQYLINRFFPGDHLHEDLTAFASAAEGKPSLGDVLFYLACRSETILALAAESVVWPALSDGGVARAKITQFVQSRLGSEKGSKRTSQAIARSYQHYGIGEATRDRLIVSVRRGDLASFAYVLHLEFPESEATTCDACCATTNHVDTARSRKLVSFALSGIPWVGAIVIGIRAGSAQRLGPASVMRSRSGWESEDAADLLPGVRMCRKC